MSQPGTIDYNALAKQYGATSSQPAVDYNALARQFGANDPAPVTLNARRGGFSGQPLPKLHGTDVDPAFSPFGPPGTLERNTPVSLKESLRPIGMAAATVAPMLTGGASLPVQAVVTGASGAAQSKLQGGSNAEAGVSGALGAALPVAGSVVSKGVQMLPSFQRAGQLFKTVADAAKGLPVDTGNAGNTALEIRDLSETGGTMPKVIRNFIQRVTDPNRGPLVYEEARNFASNASRLSSNEWNNLTPKLQRLVGQFARQLNDSITDTAGTVGQAENYQNAMQEWGAASNRAAKLDALKTEYGPKVLKGAAEGLGGSAALGGMYGLYKLLSDK